MTTINWILTGIIAVIFTFTGFSKMFIPKVKLLAKGMKGLADLDENQIKMVGLLEVLGVIGLILPELLNISPVISSVSAFCLSLTMLVAGWINYRLKLAIIPNILIFILCILFAFLILKYS